jgi:hypothetical protein
MRIMVAITRGGKARREGRSASFVGEEDGVTEKNKGDREQQKDNIIRQIPSAVSTRYPGLDLSPQLIQHQQLRE